MRFTSTLLAMTDSNEGKSHLSTGGFPAGASIDVISNASFGFDEAKHTYDGTEKDLQETRSTAKSTSPSQSEYGPDDEVTIVAFEQDDPSNPYNWKQTKKTCR